MMISDNFTKLISLKNILKMKIEYIDAMKGFMMVLIV